jgi:hypothetical protein
MNPHRMLVVWILTAVLAVGQARANDDDLDGNAFSTPVTLGALSLGGGTLALLGGSLMFGAGVFFYTSPTTFTTNDNSGVIIAQALIVGGSLGLGLGLCLATGGTGILVGHTFFE